MIILDFELIVLFLVNGFNFLDGFISSFLSIASLKFYVIKFFHFTFGISSELFLLFLFPNFINIHFSSWCLFKAISSSFSVLLHCQFSSKLFFFNSGFFFWINKVCVQFSSSRWLTNDSLVLVIVSISFPLVL
jgi:hypothetical protein